MNVNFVLIGKRIKEIRKQQKITQDQLAEMSNLTVGYISHVETGRKKASLSSLINISNALGITLDELLTGNQLHNPTDYQTDIDILMSDCSLMEKRMIYELVHAAKSIFRNNGWIITSTTDRKNN